MPRIVDHDGRRRELVETTWRVVASRGLGGATMRQIAEEAGYANGALKPYFPTKTDLVDATYAHVFQRTEARIDEAVVGLRGLAALRCMCLEILPVHAELLEEARLAITFWDQAARNEAEAAAAAATLGAWRRRLARCLDQARDDGELAARVDPGVAVEVLLGWLFGAQITGVVDPERHGPEGLSAQLDGVLALLGVDGRVPSA